MRRSDGETRVAGDVLTERFTVFCVVEDVLTEIFPVFCVVGDVLMERFTVFCVAGDVLTERFTVFCVAGDVLTERFTVFCVDWQDDGLSDPANVTGLDEEAADEENDADNDAIKKSLYYKFMLRKNSITVPMAESGDFLPLCLCFLDATAINQTQTLPL